MTSPRAPFVRNLKRLSSAAVLAAPVAAGLGASVACAHVNGVASATPGVLARWGAW